MDKTICELFAGVGGFRVGFESQSAEWQTSWANQWEPSKKVQHAFECYKFHFEETGGINEFSNTDINLVDKSTIPNHSILVGGFPCQDYSVARTGAKGIQGKKGVLWWDIYSILEEKKSPFILLENVDRLIKSPTNQRGRDFGIILSCLNNLGYLVEWRVINAAEYGFQQRRRRIFIFASLKTNNYSKTYTNPSVDIFNSTGFFAQTFPIDKVELEDIHETEIGSDTVEISDSFKFEFMNSGILKNNTIYTTKTKPANLLTEKQITLQDKLETFVDDKYFLDETKIHKWETTKGPKAIERTSKSGHTYMFREGQVPFPDFLDRPARTMLTSENSINRSTHVILDPEVDKLRKLTPVECERLNGFPDNWTNTGMTESFRYFCMGNALVVDLIRHFAKKLETIIESEN